MILSDINGLSRCSEKRVICKCDTCGAITQTTFANYRRAQESRGMNGKTYCRSCVCREKAQKRVGKPAHNKGKKLPPEKKGSNHPSWKGGRYVSNDGYVMVYVGGDKKDIGWHCYKKEHVIVCEEVFGRKLTEKDVVHHIDGDKQNNQDSNLWLTNHKGHRNAHQSLQEIGYQLVRSGLISFDKETGIYRWNHENFEKTTGLSDS